LCHPRLFGIEAGVLDGGRGAQGEILRELEVVVAEAAAALGGGERQRAERAVGGPHRHDHQRAHADPSDRLELLRVLNRVLAEPVRDLGQQLGGAAPDDAGDAGGRRRVGRVAAAQVRGHGDLLGVGVRERDLLDRAVGVRQVDGAPVRQPRDGEPGDALQRLLVVEARSEELSGAGEEALALLGLLGLRDVLDDVDRVHAALVLEQRGLREQPVRLAGRLVDAPGEQLRGRLASDEPAAREVVRADRVAVLLGDHEVGRELAGAGGGDLVGRVAAEQPDRRGVGVDRPALVVVDRDGLGEAVEDAVEAGLRGAQVGDEAGVGEDERDAPGNDPEEGQVVPVVAIGRRREPEVADRRAGADQRDERAGLALEQPRLPRLRRRGRFGAVLEQAPRLAVRLPEVDPAAVCDRGHERVREAVDGVLEGLGAGQPADRGQDGHAGALPGHLLECGGRERRERAAGRDDRDPQQVVGAAPVVVPVAAGDRERDGDRAHRGGRASVTRHRERERRQHEGRREDHFVGGDDVDGRQPRRQDEREQHPATDPRTADASPGGDARLTVCSHLRLILTAPVQRAASPSSRSTRIVSFHSPSRRPWRLWTPTSAKPAARCSFRLAWFVVKTRLVSL